MDVMKLENVWYRYPERPYALEDISLAIANGERVSLVGPNGAGKSTLLHLMAGLYFPNKGKVEVQGTPLTKKDARLVRQKVGFLFQDPDDQIFMPSVWEDVAFGPINMGLEEAEVRDRVDKAMVLAGIPDFKDRVPHRLSIGEKKRVAIAGLLAMSPPMLLLDEPTANLDPQGRRDLVNILESWTKGSFWPPTTCPWRSSSPTGSSCSRRRSSSTGTSAPWWTTRPSSRRPTWSSRRSRVS